MPNSAPVLRNQDTDIVARFEPARAVVRPRSCDEREGCWVKLGPPACNGNGGYSPECRACGGSILFSGHEAAHRRALIACLNKAGSL